MPTSNSTNLDNRALELASRLVRIPSESALDERPLLEILSFLKPLGFAGEIIRSPKDVPNLWAELGSTGPLLVFLGHTDVVPSGAIEAWTYPPYSATIADGKLFGRGTADMKGGIAAFLAATEAFVAAGGGNRFRIGILIAGDEESSATGTPAVLNHLRSLGRKPDQEITWCLCGEPTSGAKFGDTLKTGRRGSLTARASISGIQGHVAYHELARNPIHTAVSAMACLLQTELDAIVATGLNPPDEKWGKSSIQITEFHAGLGASNVIPAEANLTWNIRYRPPHTRSSLIALIEQLLQPYPGITIRWSDGAEAYESKPGSLCAALEQSIFDCTSIRPEHSRSGGTSDARFLAGSAAEIVEFGLSNQTIHMVNEHVPVDDLSKLAQIYFALLTNLDAILYT